MALSRDLVQLKLQKRLIEEKLAVTDLKIDRYGQILDKKAALKGEWVSPEKKAHTSLGLTIADLRIPPRACKALPVDHTYDPYATKPEAVVNPNILRIRQTQRLKSDGTRLLQEKLKEKEDLSKRNRPKEQHQHPRIPIPESMLPNRYLRGELPCTIEHGVSGKYLSWASPLEFLDYEYYLPIFFDGLQVKDRIITFIACQGIEDMLYAARGHPDRIRPVIPLLVRPLRNALSKFDMDILLWTLKAMQQLITCNVEVGEVLMPYSKQFLAPIALFMDRNKNLGDAIDYGQRKCDDIGEEV